MFFQAGCKLALALTKYTRMTTYMWMFCEGFYLHKLIVTAFAEEKRLAVYYFIGWGKLLSHFLKCTSLHKRQCPKEMRTRF